MSRKLLVLLLVVLVGSGAYVAADAADLVPGVLTIAPDPPPLTGPLPTPATEPSSTPGPPPTRAGLERDLTAALADPALGRSVAYSVRDGVTGEEILARGTAQPRRVASLQKLLTAFAVTTELDLEETLRTRVTGDPAGGDLALVAGGDMYLSAKQGNPDAVFGRAGLAELADRVVAARGADAGRTVLHLDLSYAAGPAVPPTWHQADLDEGFTGPVTMLGLASQRAEPGHPAPADPAQEAAKAFVERLRERGVDAVLAPAGSTLPPALTGTGATELAAVESAPLRAILEQGVQESDNAQMENLARQAMAAAGVDTASSTGAWVTRALAAAGVDTASVRITDASGLSADQKVSVAVISQLLQRAVDGRDPDLRPVVLELPVAGLSGSLTERFEDPDTRDQAGVPRGKTGTLTGVSALGGWTMDASGHPLLYVIVADAVPPGFFEGTEPARAALDRAVATLTRCGCR